MNILLVTPFPLSGTGGITTIVRMLAREFERAGHRAAILVPGTSNHLERRGDDEGIAVHATYLRTPSNPEKPIRALVAFLVMLPFTLVRLGRHLRQTATRLIVIQYPLPQFWVFGVLRGFVRCPVVVVCQGNDVHNLPDYGWERRLVGGLLRRADRVVAVSRSLLEELGGYFPDVARRGVVIPNGAPEGAGGGGLREAVEEGLPERYVLFAGQLVPRKGVDLVIEAVGELALEGCRVDLVLAGDGPQRGELEALACERRVRDRVHFLGTRSHDEVIRLMRRAEAVVLASRAEGLPLVVVEAMSCGKPVVATRIDGVPEIVEHERTGLLVDPEDTRGLAGALRRLSEDAALRRRLGESAAAVIHQGYSWKAVAGRYLALVDPSPRGGRRGVGEESGDALVSRGGLRNGRPATGSRGVG